MSHPSTAAAAERPTWAPGSRVGAYRLLAKLATGGMAEIWLARQQGLKGFERVVVVKRIIESLSTDPSFVNMFLDEARIAAQLAHPNIVQIFDLGEHAGAYYLAMEYLPGEHLSTLARAAIRAGEPLPFQAAVKICVDALEGLAHAHSRVGLDGKPLNVVHRDVSPQNILITVDGLVKVVDFGIARAANRATVTSGNMVKGKFAYMAPEQARSQATLDGRADLFAVGAILYELVTRKRLWTTKDQVQQLAELIAPDPIQPVCLRSPAVPADLGAIIDRALAKNPAQRWPDALTFKAALEGWLRANGGAPSNTELAQRMRTLFADRIQERALLLEQASSGHFPGAGPDDPVKPPTDRSMPGATPTGHQELGARRKKPRLALVGLALLAGTGAAALYWALHREPPAGPAVVELPLPPEPAAQAKEPAPAKPAAPRPAELKVETEPAGATIQVDGEVRGTSPITLEGLEPGAHQLEARLEGHLPFRRAITIKGPGESSTLVLPLVREPAKAEPGKKGPPPPPAARGKLSLATDPWTRVMLKDKVLGDTPLIEVSVPAGRHRLRLVNEQQKLDLTIEVEVKAGQTTKKQLKL